MSIDAEPTREISGTATAELKLTVPQKFEIHLQDATNPHSVTAEQVGTYSKTEIDSKVNACLKLADIYIDSDNYLCINTGEQNGED